MRSSVYTKAAKDITDGCSRSSFYACWAIKQQTKDTIYYEAFRQLFSPTLDTPTHGIAGKWFGAIYEEEAKLARSLALLFMAEIAKEL